MGYKVVLSYSRCKSVRHPLSTFRGAHLGLHFHLYCTEIHQLEFKKDGHTFIHVLVWRGSLVLDMPLGMLAFAKNARLHQVYKARF